MLKQLLALLLLPMALASSVVCAAEQVVTLASETPMGATVVQVAVLYDTAPSPFPSLPGLGVRVHYDSAQLQALNIAPAFSAHLIGTQMRLPDTDDLDGDPDTDVYALLAWADAEGRWPGELPARLAVLEFMHLGDRVTTVRTSAADFAAGYGFRGDALDLQP